MCNATNDGGAIDPVQISWYNGTKLLKSDRNYITIYNRHDNVADKIQSLLILDSVNSTDDGEYICRAFNDPLCYTEIKINLTVECAFIIALPIFKAVIPLIMIVLMCINSIGITTTKHAYGLPLLYASTTLLTICDWICQNPA